MLSQDNIYISPCCKFHIRQNTIQTQICS